MVDKVEAKKYAASIIGEEHIIPTLGVWERFEDIDFASLPDRFVLKPSHDSASVIIVADKSKMNVRKARKKMNKSLRRNYYMEYREYPYKNVKPRILAEQFMVDESGTELKDYKIFCFDGVPKVIQVDFGRFTKHERNLYTPEWEYIPAQIKYPTNPRHQITRPECLREMLEVASNLSKGLTQARVDLYVIYDKIYFGEITLYHGSGCEKFNPTEFGKTMGDYIKIPKK